MDNEYQNLKAQSKEIFELIDCKCWLEVHKKIKELYPKYPDHTIYVSELSEIMKETEESGHPNEYLTKRKNEMAGKKIQEIWDAITDFESYISKPRTELK
jgi:hypothetical protein